jgi:hypothetical protein
LLYCSKSPALRRRSNAVPLWDIMVMNLYIFSLAQ